MESIIEPEPFSHNGKRPVYMGFLFFAGVLLPVVAVSVELSTRMCTEELFDPMPTWWHTFFIFFVIVTNLQTWWAIRQNRSERMVWLGLANAVTVFIAGFYTILFMPVLPLAIIGILAFLLGMLPMAPLFSLIAALIMRWDLRRMAPDVIPFSLRLKGLAVGFLTVFLAIGAAELTLALTKIGIDMTNSGSVETQIEGLKLIRRYGDENYLLRLCYDSSGVVVTDYLLTLLKRRASGEGETEDLPLKRKAQKAFYRLKGADYRTVSPPRGVKDWERYRFNEQTGDPNSGWSINGLSLSGSQIDGSIDGDAAAGYLEWTLTLKNETRSPQEAIAQIQLPPGAVVSRLTLWINGEEREAAFAGKGQVTDAYNAVKTRRRDPVLITNSGKDRVSMSASPVPVDGEMKIRIGITMPLELENETTGRLQMPYFQERNFAVSAEHAIWFESKKPLEIANQNFIQEQLPKFFSVRGKVSDEELIKLGSPIRVIKSADVANVWTRDKNDPQKIVRQEIKESDKPKSQRIIFVVDTSARMKDFQNEIARTLKNISFDAETALVLTGGNGLNTETSAPGTFVGSPNEIAARIENADFDGGADAVEAIAKAWELAQEKPGSAIVWIHAPQIVQLASPQNLKQMWARRADSPIIYSLQSKLGRDVIEKKLNESNIVETVTRFGSLGDDLSRHLERISRHRRFEFIRMAGAAKSFKPLTNTKETSDHLARLWANDEVTRLLADKSPGNEQAALDLAIKYQLVTPVSGAVVLETKEQYDQFDLRPVEANTVPTIPEPEEYLLFGVVLSLVIWMFWRAKRRKPQTI